MTNHNNGFTKSYRSKWQNPVFRNLLEAAIWSWMCDTAVWQDTKIRYNGKLIDLKRGQLVTSIRFISSGFNMGEQVTRTFLENLEKDGMTNTQPTHRGSIITICNYDKYQSDNFDKNTHTNTQPTHSQHTANTNKKEDKNIRSKEDNPIIPLPDWMPLTEWEAFKDMRKRIKKPMTAHAEKLVIGKIDKYRGAGHDPTAMLNQSILNGWQDIYEPKENNHGKQNNNSKPTWTDAGKQLAEKYRQQGEKLSEEGAVEHTFEPVLRITENIR